MSGTVVLLYALEHSMYAAGRAMQPDDYWAKTEKDKEGRIVAWLPLEDHLLDVGMTFEALLVCGHERPLARTLGLACLSAAQRDLLCFLAFVHDVGKINIGFQVKAFEDNAGAGRASGGHTSEALAGILRRDPDFLPHVAGHLGLASLHRWLKPSGPRSDLDTLFLLAAVLGHHGWPLPIGVPTGDPVGILPSGVHPIWSGWLYADPKAVCARIGAIARQAWPLAFGEPDPFSITPAFLDGLTGLLTLADWIGSDQDRFPVRRRPDDRTACSRRLAAEAVIATGIASPGLLDRACSAQAEAFLPFAPNPMQSILWSEAGSLPEGGLWILEAETGGGKTEAALGLFHRLLAFGMADSLYFALPTRTSASQIHRRATTFASAAFGETLEVALAVPGYLADGGRIPGRPSSVGDDTTSSRPPWAAERPKRYLAAAAGVGTVDQLLAGVVDVKHSAMRWASAARSLLVIDEVHASDAYGTALMAEAVRRHVGRGGHVLAMSATLGAAARSLLVDAAAGRRRITRAPTLADASDLDYPLLTVAGRSGSRPVRIDPPERRKAVHVSTCALVDDVSALACLVADHVRSGARVLVIRNTVRGATSLHQALEKVLEPRHFVRLGGVPVVHHGRFAREDRSALDAVVEKAFGKGVPGPETGLVLVGTQTLEQSLDIDADLLVTDLCPIDVLLQRIGRLHRHERDDRPPGYVDASCVLVVPSVPMLDLAVRAAHGIGRGGAYADVRIVDATLRAVVRTPSLVLPDDNRRLVEAATHPEALDGYADEWREHSIASDGRRMADALTADQCVRKFVDLEFSTFPSRNPNEEQVATRLGLGSLQLDLEPALKGPFGIICRQVSFQAWQLRGLLLYTDPKAFATKEGDALHLDLCGKAFVYDRFGLRGVS